MFAHSQLVAISLQSGVVYPRLAGKLEMEKPTKKIKSI